MVMASWTGASADVARIAWVRDTWRELRRFSTGGNYVDFLGDDHGDDRVRAAYGSNHAAGRS